TAAKGLIDDTAIGNVVVTARDNAALNATGDISNSSILAENAAKLALNGDLNNNTVTAGSIEITGLANIENGSYVAKTAALSVDASGTIEGATFTAELSSVDLDADGSIFNSTVTALTTADLTAMLIADTSVVAGDGITTSGMLRNNTLTSHGDVVIKNASIIDNLEVAAAKITATENIGTITDGILISDGATTVSAQSILGTAFDAATADLTAANSIEGIDVRVDTNAKLNSASILDSDVIVSNADGSIEVKATAIDGGSLRADKVSFDEFATDADIQVGAASAVRVLGAENITVDNGGLVNIVSENDQDTTFTVAASDDVFLTQGNGNMLVDITADGQVVTLTAAADIDGAVAGVDITAKNLIITTAENVTVDTEIEQIKANVAYDLDLNEVDDLAVDLISAGRKAKIDAGGDILDSADDRIIDIVTPELALNAGGSIGTLTNALDISTQKLTADADALINLLNVSAQNVTVKKLIAGTSVYFAAEGSGEHRFTGDVIGADGDVKIDSAAGDLVFANFSTLEAKVDADITAYGDITTEGIVFLKATDGDPDTTNSDLNIVSKHGSVTFSSGTMAQADGYLTVAALENDVLFAGGTLEAGKVLAIGAGGSVYSRAVLWAEENVIIAAYEKATLNGPVTANTGSVVVFAETDDLTVNAPITAATDIHLETMDDLISINDALTAAAVSLTSEKGDILSSGAGTIDAATIEVDTGGKVDLIGKLTASEWVDIEAIGSVTAADIDSGDVTVKTTGFNADIDINLTADDTDLVARAEGIDSDIWVVGKDMNLNDVYAFDGDVTIRGANLYARRVQALDEGEINELEDDAHSVNIIADGTLLLGMVRADYNAIIDADDDVTSDGGLDIEAGNDIDMTLGGTAGTVGGFPITVIAGGKVKVGKKPSTPYYGKKIWVLMQGISGDSEIHYSTPGNNPPGTIVWNGKVWGGTEKALLNMDRGENAIMGEVRGILERYQATNLWYSGFQYFPHVRAHLDGYQGNMSIEHILTGRGTVEGLPEGVGPGVVIDFLELDESYRWQDQDKQASVK
ncbi:MAG: hypothetical protein GX946_03590, partial [Oligosphaeraceae bacterium]|nr:hypothetical protein [Oligosphaeraceae bacterium]